jgi:hypothetical protein
VALAYPVVDAPPGNQVYCVPINPSTYGTVGSVTHAGAGVGTLAVAAKPGQAFQIKCIAGGSATTSTWQTSYDGGLTYGATWTAAASIQVPGVPFVTLAFGGGTSVSGDIVSFATQGAPTLTGTGTLTPTVGSACPYDAYTALVTITTGGALGTAQFTYTLDGGNTTQGPS